MIIITLHVLGRPKVSGHHLKTNATGSKGTLNLYQKSHGNVRPTAYNHRMDTISILTARSKICTKRFTKDQDGVYVGLDQSIGYLFDHSSAPINSLSTLSELLLDLESRTDAYVIRGNLIEGRQQQAIRRTLKPRQGQEPFFGTASRSWCMIDIDDLPLPEELSDYKNNKAKLVAHAVSKLPSQFQGVQLLSGNSH